MAESMSGLHRSHRCTEVTNALVGKLVTLMGWVQKRRNLGSLIFIDLRDRSGLMQVVFDEPVIGSEGFAKAADLRSEFVVAVVGIVQKRAAAVNENLATGDIEVMATELRILSSAQTPPFPIEENSKTKEELRLKYRYLDLRRDRLKNNIIVRSNIMRAARTFFYDNNFGSAKTLPDFDWSLYPGVGTYKEGTASYFTKFLVDENKGTYKMVQQFAVPYSSVVSGVNYFGDNITFSSGMDHTYGEYDKEGKMICTYTYEAERYAYRVIKYNFEDIFYVK